MVKNWKDIKCTRPKDVERRDYSQHCTGRYPHYGCEYLSIMEYSEVIDDGDAPSQALEF